MKPCTFQDGSQQGVKGIRMENMSYLLPLFCEENPALFRKDETDGHGNSMRQFVLPPFTNEVLQHFKMVEEGLKGTQGRKSIICVSTLFINESCVG